MKNRAKCKLCGDIIESMHTEDCQYCLCGEIYVKEGQSMRCGSKSWENFLRIDDDGNEVVPQIIEGEEEVKTAEIHDPTPEERKEILLNHLKGMVDSFDNLPSGARTSFVTQMDLHYALLTIYEIVRNI